MILLVAGAANRASFHPDYIGDFTSPARRQQVGATPVWAADNGCFSGFDEARFHAMLARIAAAPVPPKFVTLPDVVGSYRRTVNLWGIYHHTLARLNLNRAFVLQNGVKAEVSAVPWDYIEALFIGGDTAFKLGPIARYHVEVAKGMGKWVHMGRVNSVKRMLYARAIGCDSCDGSGMSRFPDCMLPPMVRALELAHYTETHQLNLL